MLRRGTAEGRIVGPRIVSSGPSISIIGGHGDVTGFRPEVLHALSAENTCTGAEQCAQRVREASRAAAVASTKSRSSDIASSATPASPMAWVKTLRRGTVGRMRGPASMPMARPVKTTPNTTE